LSTFKNRSHTLPFLFPLQLHSGRPRPSSSSRRATRTASSMPSRAPSSTRTTTRWCRCYKTFYPRHWRCSQMSLS